MEADKIKIISSKDFDEQLWRQFYELTGEITQRHYSDEYDSNRTFENFRKKRNEYAENDNSYNEYLVLVNDKAEAWLNNSIHNNELSIGFDMLNDNTDEVILNAVFKKFYEIMAELNFTEALHYTYRQPICIALKNAGAIIDEEYLISRLDRNDMNKKFYNNIVAGNDLNHWKSEYYSTFPQNVLNQYVQLHNEAFNDMVMLNPFNVAVKEVNFNYIKSVMETQKQNGVTNPMYILFDGSGEIAGLSSIFMNSAKLNSLSHIGTLTAVIKKHRGKGIAKYLKAKLYLKLLEENNDFKFITTDTMPWNKAMYHINNEFGFKMYMSGCQFKITKQFLENYLNQN